MPNYNHVEVLGHLTRDIELRATPSGQQMGKGGIAVNKRWQDKATKEWKEKAAFFDFQIWGDGAKRAADACKKGSAVFIVGELAFDQWDDKETGQKKSKVYINAQKFIPWNKVETKQAAPQAAQPAENEPDLSDSPF